MTLDKVYELVEGNLSSEKRTDIHEIGERFKDDPEDQGWALRVAKVVCLLEFLRDLPRTEANIAAFLVDRVGMPAPVAQVQAAVKKLDEAQFLRETEDGWKLMTLPEKNWEKERENLLDPKPRERNEITRNVLREIFGEPALKTYRHKELRNFRIGVAVEGVTLEDGDLPLTLCIADDPDDLSRKLNEVREESRQKSHDNDLYWVFALTPEIDALVAQTFASRKMVEKYDQMRAQSKINADEATCLQDEKNAVLKYESRLRDKLTEAMERGTGVFRGVARDASSLGKNLGEILKKLYGYAVPDLYPKLEMGSRPLKGTEAEDFLKAADLKALPPLFYGGEQGLGLVVKDGAKFVPNPAADIAKEVLDYLVGEHGYGNKESRTGKALEKKFGGIGYGWDRDMLRLVLAVLFRAGSIEITHGGEKFDSYQEPRSRTPLVNNTAFKSALFTPVKPIDLSTLKRAVESYEDLTGDTVDMDKNAIAEALKKFAAEEIKRVLPIEAQVKAHRLPVLNTVEEYRDTLTSIESGTADDCVTILAGGGASLRLPTTGFARSPTASMRRGSCSFAMPGEQRARSGTCSKLRGTPTSSHGSRRSGNFVYRVALRFAILDRGGDPGDPGAFRTLYEAPCRPVGAVRAAIEKIKGREEWSAVPETMREPVLHPLQSRCCTELHLPDGSHGVQDLRGDVEPDGIGRGGAGRVVRPGGGPDPEARHAARNQVAAGAGGRVLRRRAGNRGSGQAGGRPFAGPPADAAVRGRQDRAGVRRGEACLDCSPAREPRLLLPPPDDGSGDPNKLRSVVTQCRRLLEESIAQQLQGRFDIYATGKKDEVKAKVDVPLGHLSDEEPQARQDILAHFEHIKALGYKPKRRPWSN